MPKRVTKKIEEKITELYKQGTKVTHISKILDVDKVTVYKYLRKSGSIEIPEEVSKASGSRLTDDQRDMIVELYKEGATVDAICDTVGCSKPTLYIHIRKEGLERGADEDALSRAIYLYFNSKLTPKEIIEQTGVSKATLYRRIKKYKEEREG